MNSIDDLDATLRSLDPADRHVDPANARARADLHAILATDPVTSGQHAPAPPQAIAGRPRRTARRVAAVGGMAAAIAAAMVAVPSLTGGDQAFATWAAVPEDMSAQQRPEAAADCRENQEEGPGTDYVDDLETAETAIAENRGVWTTVVLAGADGFSALCITDNSAGLFNKGMIGSIGIPFASDYEAPGPRDLLATDLGTGSMNGRDLSLAAGQVGSDIIEVVYPSRVHGNVAATVSHGRFALWLPGDELKNASSNGVDVQVTYRDGTTATSTLTL